MAKSVTVNNARASRLFPVGLRLTTLVARFLLIFFLARLLPVEEVGLYGLFLATISFTVFIFGFDFYTYSTRQVLRSEASKWRTFLRSQVAFSLCLYGAIGPLLLALFWAGLLPWSMASWFFLLLALEHLGLELDRMLIAMSDQMGASVGLFLRQATTPLLMVPLMVWIPGLRELTAVLAAWVLFDAVGVAAGLFYLRRHLRNKPRGYIDWKWIRAGVRVAIPFLIGTLCLRSLFTFDRQLVALFGSLETLGAYTLFISIGAGMTQVLHAGVLQFSYPRLIKAAQQHDREGFRACLRSLGLQILIGVVTISVGVILFQPFILQFVGNGTYAQYIWILPWVMLVTGLYNLSLLPHYALYALDEDRAILYTTIGAFVVFAGVSAALIGTGVVTAVLSGVGAASISLLVLKSFSYWHSRRRLDML